MTTRTNQPAGAPANAAAPPGSTSALPILRAELGTGGPTISDRRASNALDSLVP